MSFYDDASWLLIPEGIEEDIVFAQKPTSGLGDLQFTRASDATRTNSAGVIERTPWNLLQFSEQFDNAAWTKLNITITSNEAVSPTGTLTADKVVQSVNVGSDLRTTSTFSLVSGNTYTWSIYAKNAGYKYVRLIAWSSDDPVTIYDLDSISVVSESGPAHTSTIQDVGNGWRRLTITRTVSSAVGWVRCVPLSTANGSGTPNNIDGVYLWGAPVVEGTDAKPYFATTNRQDVPRIDFRNADGTLSSCGRLLLEPQRTNRVLYSEQFDNAAWVKSVATVTANTTISPDGSQNADTIAFTASAIAFCQQIVAGAFESQSHTVSVYAKVASGTATFRLKCTHGGVTDYFSSDFTATTTWQRFTFTATFGATIGTSIVCGVINGTNALAKNVIFYGFQTEANASYATTYIPTTTAAVTRIADTASKTGVSSLIGQTEGTWFCEIDLSKLLGTTARDFFVIGDGRIAASASTVYCSFSGIGSNLLRARVVQSGVVKYDQRHTITATGTYKIALAYKSQNCAMYVNGSFVGTVAQDDPFAISLNQIFTSFDSSTNQFADGIAQAALFPTRLTNAQLVTLTT